MKNTPIRLLVFIGTLTMVAILVVQVFWVSKSIGNQEEQFNRSVQMALRTVVEEHCKKIGDEVLNNPIDQLSNNYFIARTNYRIDLASLDTSLKEELLKRGIQMDYEYGIYDCQSDRMVYGDFVSMQDKEAIKPRGNLPKLTNDEYYFGIYFPGKAVGLVSSLGIWQLTSILTLLILIFFSYALVVILKQKRLSEVQRDFINNMTHEFKTPLATLQVSAEVLESATGERQKKYAQIMKSELQRLEKHVQQLLETSRMDHNDEQKQQLFDAQRILQGLVDKFLLKEGKDFKIDLNSDPIFIKGDPLVFETIIYNLLDNAFKYGNKLVQFRLSRDHKWVKMEISNDGKIIAASDRKKIFEKFYRIKDGDLHDVKGFGLGLYFVKQGVKQLRGQIEVSDGQGLNVFTLKIPVSHE